MKISNRVDSSSQKVNVLVTLSPDYRMKAQTDFQIGLALYEDLKQRIPREECKQIYDIVKREALIIDPKLDIEIMGSYRRGADNSGDVDFLITRNAGDGMNHSGVIERLVKRLMYMGVITHEVSLSPIDLLTGS